MLLVNETHIPAALLSSVIDDNRIAASVVVRATYMLSAGRLVLSDSQGWQVSGAPTESAHGPMEAETPFVKGGVDIFVFGSARSPKKVPVSKMDVGVDVGTFTRRANVFGERIWVRRDGKRLEPSRAGVFVEMPLTMAHTFGGSAAWDELPVPFMDNPAGKGFYIDEDAAEGAPLANIEELDSPASEWNAILAPCGFGFCPLANAARFRNGWRLSADQSEITDVNPLALNTAFPKMIAPKVEAGDVMRLHGMDHDGTLAFAIPAAPAVVLLRFGDTLATREPAIDQIGVEVDARRVFVTYRFPFRYTIRRRELRGARLIARGEDAR